MDSGLQRDFHAGSGNAQISSARDSDCTLRVGSTSTAIGVTCGDIVPGVEAGVMATRGDLALMFASTVVVISGEVQSSKAILQIVHTDQTFKRPPSPANFVSGFSIGLVKFQNAN